MQVAKIPVIAYLANEFPAVVEPYVGEEIAEFRRRGVTVVACSARFPADAASSKACDEVLYLQSVRVSQILRAAWFALQNFRVLLSFIRRIMRQGHETAGQRMRALLHTALGAYFAVLLQPRGVKHIHVHHGHFGAWIAMVAARLLGIPFTMTLHGSDLLRDGAYLDTKLAECSLCVTVSEFNRCYILEHFPGIPANKISVQRLGVSVGSRQLQEIAGGDSQLTLLAVGRLHAVKDHAFLLRACRRLKDRGKELTCMIAGEGSERPSLERMILDLGLRDDVQLLGHVPHERLEAYCAAADIVTLTSKSEGIPVALMEAMSYGKVVLAPAITGVPELVIDGETGFLYRAGDLDDFLARVEMICDSLPELGRLRKAARQHILENFNQQKNVAGFCDLLLARFHPDVRYSYANSVLQQVQLSV